MSFEQHQELIQGLAAAIKGLRLYPMHHPAIEQRNRTLLNVFNQLLSQNPVVRMGLLEGTLFVDDTLFADDNPAAIELVKLFKTLEIEGFEISAGLNRSEIERFLELVMNPPAKGEDFGAAMQDKGVEHLQVAILKKTDELQDENSPGKVYGKALKAINDIFEDVRMGRIPSADQAVGVVKNMARLTLEDPHALFALSLLKDYDNYTFTHSVNVSVISLAVGRACRVSEEALRDLGLGGLLHDIGKLKVDVSIINKPGKLTDAEFTQIKLHPTYGADIVKQMSGTNQNVIDIIEGHHLRFDRTGYPEDARGRQISPLADMAAVADTYDAMTTMRSYQNPMTPRKALELLRKNSGTTLNSDFLERFASSLGTYPVGTLVRLDTNELGLVIAVGLKNTDEVKLKMLFGTVGEKLPSPYIVDLQAHEAKRIVGEVDPFIKGIDVADYFDRK